MTATITDKSWVMCDADEHAGLQGFRYGKLQLWERLAEAKPTRKLVRPREPRYVNGPLSAASHPVLSNGIIRAGKRVPRTK